MYDLKRRRDAQGCLRTSRGECCSRNDLYTWETWAREAWALRAEPLLAPLEPVRPLDAFGRGTRAGAAAQRECEICFEDFDAE